VSDVAAAVEAAAAHHLWLDTLEMLLVGTVLFAVTAGPASRDPKLSLFMLRQSAHKLHLARYQHILFASLQFSAESSSDSLNKRHVHLLTFRKIQYLAELRS
jgi:hypothetical protein